MKRLRHLIQEWRKHYSGDMESCARELEELLNVIDQESAPKVDGVSDTDTGRGTYFPDRKVVGS